MAVLYGVIPFLIGYINSLSTMLNLLTNSGTILEKWRPSEPDIALKGPMFSINQTLFSKGLFNYTVVPKQENALVTGKHQSFRVPERTEYIMY